MRIVVARGADRDLEHAPGMRGKAAPRPLLAREHAIGERRGDGRWIEARRGHASIRRTAESRRASSPTCRRPASTGSRPRRTPPATPPPSRSLPVNRTLAQWRSPSVATSSTSASRLTTSVAGRGPASRSRTTSEYISGVSTSRSAARSPASCAACSAMNCCFACCAKPAASKPGGNDLPAPGVTPPCPARARSAARRPIPESATCRTRASCLRGRLRHRREAPAAARRANSMRTRNTTPTASSASRRKVPRPSGSPKCDSSAASPRPAAMPAIGPSQRDMPDGAGAAVAGIAGLAGKRRARGCRHDRLRGCARRRGGRRRGCARRDARALGAHAPAATDARIGRVVSDHRHQRQHHDGERA